MASDGPIDLVFVTRHLIDIVPNPWQAYDFAEDAVARLRKRYGDARIRRDLGFVIEELKKLLAEERNRLAEAVFRGLIERGELNFYLLSGHAGGALPDRISVPANARRLTTETNAPLQRSFFDYMSEDEVNTVEKAVALYLDEQHWVLTWYRNLARVGYSLQGWHEHRVYPDFIAMRGSREGDPVGQDPSTIYVLETKGLHLKNEGTDYKQQLFALCNEKSQPTPWDAIAREFSDHKIHFRVIFEDEWQRVLNAMLQPS